MHHIKIKQVKQEIRIISIITIICSNEKWIFGLISKGKIGIEGVTCVKSTESLTKDIIEMIKKSKHFDQIRVILLDKDRIPKEPKIDLLEIFKNLGKPILVLNPVDGLVTSYSTEFVWRDHKMLTIGLDSRTAFKVLEIISNFNEDPEVLRILNLLILTIFRNSLHKI